MLVCIKHCKELGEYEKCVRIQYSLSSLYHKQLAPTHLVAYKNDHNARVPILAQIVQPPLDVLKSDVF